MGSARIAAGIGVAVMLTAMGLPQASATQLGNQYQTWHVRQDVEGYSSFREPYPAPRVYTAPYVPQRTSAYRQKVVHHKRYR